MVVARALDDGALADDLREACMTVALQLGGWTEPSPQLLNHNRSRRV
jgi:hypothetical protein